MVRLLAPGPVIGDLAVEGRQRAGQVIVPVRPEAKVMFPTLPLLASAAVIASRSVQLEDGGEQLPALPVASSFSVVTW